MTSLVRTTECHGVIRRVLLLKDKGSGSFREWPGNWGTGDAQLAKYWSMHILTEP